MPLTTPILRSIFSLRHSSASKSHSRFFKTVPNTTVESTVSSTVSKGENAAVSGSTENEPMLTRLKLYWKALYRDYKEVFTDSLTTIKSNPLKSSVYGAFIGAIYYCAKTNPDETMFRSYFLTCTNKMNLIGESIRNSKTVDHLTLIEASSNNGVIRWLSLGIFSLIWLDDFSCDVCVYKAVCPHLGIDYFSFHRRILDIGFLGRWWILQKIMEDYDVNPNEWPVES